MATIEENGYIATASQIEALVKARIEGGNLFTTSRTTYLRALIATTQDKLGISAKAVRQGKDKADDATIKEHATALEAVHEVFYEAVQKAAKETAIVDGDRPRPKADIIASRIVFARSAYSTVRSWLVRGKHPLSSVIAAKATKQSLAAATPKRATVSSMARARALRADPILKQGKTLLERIVVAGKADKDAAVAVLHDLINMLSHGFDDLGHNANKLRQEVDHTATGVIQSRTVAMRKKAA